MRKKILDEETVTVYQKNSKGQVVPSGIPFRRNVFAPPRDHEGRIRKRLVEAEQSVARQQKERMDTFFTQMVETGWFLYFAFLKKLDMTSTILTIITKYGFRIRESVCLYQTMCVLTE